MASNNHARIPGRSLVDDYSVRRNGKGSTKVADLTSIRSQVSDPLTFFGVSILEWAPSLEQASASKIALAPALTAASVDAGALSVP